MWRAALLGWLGCGSSSMKPDAATMMDASDTSDAPVEAPMGCGSDAGCTMTVSGAVSASFPCTAKVEMPMPNTDHFSVGGGNGKVGAYTWCERFHPIMPGSLMGGCWTTVTTYLGDGGVDQTFMQNTNDGKLLCASPLSGFFDVQLSNMSGSGSLHTSF